jgi:BirA family biotin operon repressor/biotin-[acetyl-CoA-carboxylase] ligase
MELAKQNAPEGTVVLAEQQLQGRGRNGRSWHSPSGVGIYCSVVMRPRLLPAMAQLMTLMSAVAVGKAIASKTPLTPRIKWPNDIRIGDKKIAGILLESMVVSAQLQHAVIGIGINVNHTLSDFARELRVAATSLRLELGQSVERKELVCQLFCELEDLYERVQQGQYTTILDQWRSLSDTLGRHVRVIYSGDNSIEGLALDINEEGALLVRDRDGAIHPVHAGDIHHFKFQ